VNVVRDFGQNDAKPVEEGHADYLLVDHQVRLTQVTSHYSRYVERLTTQAAVDRSAQVSIYIDPEHEVALLHEVRVLRNGRAIDKLGDARRSLLNREEDLENGLLNGRVTLHLLLQDVRVGDVLDYSYTLDRRGPFGERGYNEWFSTQWTEPVRRFQLRMLSPPDRPLVVRDFGALGEAVKTTRNGWVETAWHSRPSWHFHFPRIEISEFRNWDAVRAWAKPLYRVPRRDDPELRKLIAEVRAEPNDEARLLKALRFVQDDIRYTGIEIGAGAYRPTQPAAVLSRRYGDCKDKTLLLITVLREIGIQAWPALVHSTHGRGVVDRAPSPGAFDHVIAKVHLGGKDYWLDATASGQGGDVNTLAQANYGPALVIDDSNLGLQLIPPRQALKPTHLVTETFDLRKGREKAAGFNVVTEYREDLADGMRARMRTQTATELGKEYLDYYRKTYAGIRMVKPLNIKDDRAANVYKVTEAYEIDQPYEKNDEGHWRFYLAAYLIVDRAKKPDPMQRTTPLSRAYPMHVHHEIVAYLPNKYDIDAEVVKINDPAFEYRSEVKFRTGQLRLEYDLRSASDHVPAHRVKEYGEKLERVYNDAFFTLTDMDEEKQLAASADAVPAAGGTGKGPSYLALSAALGGLGLGALVAWWLARSRWKPGTAHDDAPQGIDGWLVVPGIVTVFVPLLAALQLYFYLSDHGSAAGFDSLGTLRQWVQAGLLALAGMLLVLGAAAVWLLVKRVRTFPLLFHVLMILMVAGLALDFLVSWRSGAVGVSGIGAWIAPVASVLFCLACMSYVALSQRVRATLVRPWKAEPAA
jgi:hypothetical protein